MTDRKTLRRRVLLELGDMKVLRATANGTDSTFIDAINLIGEPNAYIDRQVLFTGGTSANLGVVTQVNGSSKNERALSFATTLPAATMTGDECELINTRGIGFTFDDVHRAINAAIADAAREATVLAAANATFDRATGSIAIPDEWSVFSGLQWQDRCDRWRGIIPAGRLGGAGWSVDRVSRTVQIAGDWAYKLDGRPVRLSGATDPAPLTQDSDETVVNPDWLVAEAAAVLLQGKYLLHPNPQAERTYGMLRQKANQLRVFTVTRRLANSVRLT